MPRAKKRAPQRTKKASKRILWTSADLKVLRSNAGQGIPKLKRALKRSEAAIRFKASQEGISLRQKGN